MTISHQIPAVLNLVRGETLLGTIEVQPANFAYPWFSGVFRATPEFESVRDLFERELELLQENSNDDSATWDDWESVHAEIVDPGLRLSSPDSSYFVEDILIHIDGTEAWWRE